jgi:acyl dehydratase
MSKLIIGSHAEFEKHVGQELGISGYLKITQEMINKFADATIDHQWIHVDEERAKTESPYKSTIAHGYLSVSVLPHLWEQVLEVHNYKMLVNYGIENLRFNQPVLVNSEVRIRVKLISLLNLRGITKATLDVVMEIKDQKKSAFDATIVFLYHFN